MLNRILTRKEGRAHHERSEGVVGLGRDAEAPGRGADVYHSGTSRFFEEGEEGVGSAGDAEGVHCKCLLKNGTQAKGGDGGFICHTCIVLRVNSESSAHLNVNNTGKGRETHNKYIQSLPP